MNDRLKLSAEPESRLYKRIMTMWDKGQSTADIAHALSVKEHFVWRTIYRERADRLGSVIHV